MTHCKSLIGSPCFRLLLIVSATTLMTGCGETAQPAAKDTDQVNSAEAVPVETKKIPKLDVQQLLQELPKNYPDDDYVDFPAAGVRMVPPRGFTKAERFHGFINAQSDASVMITMAPVSFPQMAKNLVLNVVKDPRLDLQSGFSDTVEIDGQEAAYAYFVQEKTTGPSAKHLLALGDEKTSRFVNGEYPQYRQADLAKEILKSVMSCRLIPGWNTAGPGADVDFTLSAPSLKITPGWTKSIVFTKDGTYPLADPTDPCFKAEPSLEAIQVAAEDRAKFARQQISTSPDINVEQVFIDREITVDGLPGRELMALANDVSTNTPILLYAAILFDEDSFITLHGWAGQFVDEDWGAEFKAITASYKKK